MTRVIIEGPDGTGKSTLARRLAIELGSVVVSCGPGPRSDKELYAHLRNQFAILSACSPVVMDRCTAVSHLVYSSIEKSLDDHDHMTLLGNITDMRVLGVQFVLCVTDKPSHVIKDYDTAEKIENIDRNYCSLVARYNELLGDAIRFDFTSDTVEQLLERLV